MSDARKERDILFQATDLSISILSIFREELEGKDKRGEDEWEYVNSQGEVRTVSPPRKFHHDRALRLKQMLHSCTKYLTDEIC